MRKVNGTLEGVQEGLANSANLFNCIVPVKGLLELLKQQSDCQEKISSLCFSIEVLINEIACLKAQMDRVTLDMVLTKVETPVT